MIFKRFWLLSLIALLMQGCGWWSSDEEIEPAALQTIKAERQVKTLWSSKVAGSLGEKYHSLRPALLGDRIYIVDPSGKLTAMQQESGKLIWQQALETEIIGGVGAGDGKLMVTTTDGRLLVLSALDGELQWETELSSEAVVPAQANPNLVLVQTIDGRLSAFAASSGELKWAYKADLPALTLRGTSTPVLLPNAVFAGFANGKVTAMDPNSGNVAWEARIALPKGKTELERIVDVDGQLLLSSGRIYATSYQGRLVAIQPSDGKLLWHKDLSSYRSVIDSPTQLFAVDDQGSVVSFEKSSGLEYWRQSDLFHRELTNPVMIAGLLAVADYQGYVHFISPVDGHFVARVQVDSTGVEGPLLVVDDRLYVYGNSGKLAALRVE